MSLSIFVGLSASKVSKKTHFANNAHLQFNVNLHKSFEFGYFAHFVRSSNDKERANSQYGKHSVIVSNDSAIVIASGFEKSAW
ncbi:hypothetical protein [Helicobacter sp. T3_23-1059]